MENKIVRTFEVIDVEVGSWSTRFSLKDIDHKNELNRMSPDAFIHHLGQLCGRDLQYIKGLRFTITIDEQESEREFDPLSLCGKTIGG